MAIRMMQLKRVMTLGTMIVLLIGLGVSEALAQDEDAPSPRVEAKAIVGGAVFDEVGHPMVGAALRYYITRRVSVEALVLILANIGSGIPPIQLKLGTLWIWLLLPIITKAFDVISI